jgi:transcriptional regulator with PAS, ATPase and Fis domain
MLGPRGFGPMRGFGLLRTPQFGFNLPFCGDVNSQQAGFPTPNYARNTATTPTLADVVEAAEQYAISAALATHANNLARTARALGIEHNTLKRKIRQYAI